MGLDLGNIRLRGGRKLTAISKTVKGSLEITNEVSAKGDKRAEVSDFAWPLLIQYSESWVPSTAHRDVTVCMAITLTPLLRPSIISIYPSFLTTGGHGQVMDPIATALELKIHSRWLNLRVA